MEQFNYKNPLLSGGPSPSYDYYVISTGFDIDPTSSTGAKDHHDAIKRIISERADIAQIFPTRMLAEVKERVFIQYFTMYDLKQAPHSQVYQTLISVFAHSNSWTVSDLISELSGYKIDSVRYPNPNEYSINLLHSLYSGFGIKIPTVAGIFRTMDSFDIKINKDMPSVSQGTHSQVYLSPEKNGKGLSLWYKENFKWIKLQDLSNHIRATYEPDYDNTELAPIGTPDPLLTERHVELNVYGLYPKLYTDNEWETPQNIIWDSIEPPSPIDGDIWVTFNENAIRCYKFTVTRGVASVWIEQKLTGFETLETTKETLSLFTGTEIQPTKFLPFERMIDNNFTIFGGDLALRAIPFAEGAGVNIEIFNKDHTKPENYIGTPTTITWTEDNEHIAFLTDRSDVNSVYIGLPPKYLSHWDQSDGYNDSYVLRAIDEQGIGNVTARVSQPTTEGDPFFTSGWVNTNRPTFSESKDHRTLVWECVGEDATGLGPSDGDAHFHAFITRSDTSTFTLADVDLEATKNGSLTHNGLTVEITDYQQDVIQNWRGHFKVTLDLSVLFESQVPVETSGRLFITMLQYKDISDLTGLDGPFGFSEEFFYDSSISNVSMGSGEIIKITPEEGSSGYLDTDVGSIIDIIGGNDDATAIIDIIVDGEITDITIINPGTGYVPGEGISTSPSDSGEDSLTIIVEVEKTIAFDESAIVKTKHLSGIEYYTRFSEFQTHVIDINQHNSESSGTHDSLWITCPEYNLEPIKSSPWTDPDHWSNVSDFYDADGMQYTNNDWAIPDADWRFAGKDVTIDTILFTAFGDETLYPSAPVNILVDCIEEHEDNNTMAEFFHTESRRLQSDYVTPWDSQYTLTNGEACVIGGSLTKPGQTFTMSSVDETGAFASLTNFSNYMPNANGVNPNYTGFNAPASYYSFFETDNTQDKSNFVLTINGDFGGRTLEQVLSLSDPVDGDSSDLAIFIRKKSGRGNVGPNTPYPLWVHASFDNGQDGNPQDPASAGCRLSFPDYNQVSCSVGNFSIREGLFFEIQIRDDNIKIFDIAITY